MTRKEYRSRLRWHDWDYCWSDDPGAWKRGNDEHNKLFEMTYRDMDFNDDYVAAGLYTGGNGPKPEWWDNPEL